jgi:hypothetical protein
MTKKPQLEFVGSPNRLPRPPKGRVAVLDVAFASDQMFDLATEPFIAAVGDRLALWCDHHEHAAGWAKHRDDPRFLLVPNRIAHACPELITPEVAARAGELDALVIHGDFDGLLTAVKLLRGGEPAWPEADEDARAVDSPGRGHTLSARGLRLANAVDESVANFTTGQRRDFLTALLFALVEGAEPAALAEQIDRAAEAAAEAHLESIEIARGHGKPEQPGLFVVRLNGRRKGRQRKGILRWAEEHAPIGVVIEHEGGNTWLTAATFDEEIHLGDVSLLSGGRSDYRYCELKGSVEPVLQALSRAARNR